MLVNVKGYGKDGDFRYEVAFETVDLQSTIQDYKDRLATKSAFFIHFGDDRGKDNNVGYFVIETEDGQTYRIDYQDSKIYGQRRLARVSFLSPSI